MKRFIKLGLFLVSSVLLTGCAKDEVQNKVIDTYVYVQDKDSYVLENDNLKLTLDPKTTYFQVLDKANNSTWDSNPADAADDALADDQSIKYLQSTLMIEYCDDAGIKAIYNNFEYSINKQIYTVEQGEDYIKVNYTIGDVQKKFVLPTAIPESRLKIFMDKMDASAKRKINDYYRKIDINNLRAEDNKSELLSQYPDLEKECVYVLRDGTQDYLKVKIETIFADAGYTQADYEADEARYSKQSLEDNPYFDISVVYRLDGNDLVVELPFEDMEWNDTYPLTKIKVLPYMGAGSVNDEGFLLVPEGNGGIINFNNGKSEQSSYYTQVYGWDYGIQRDSVIDESRAAFPVFGISKNGSSMLCILEDYGCVATIEADVSGRNHSYNYADATYTTLHSSSLSVSAKTDKSVMVYEAKKPTGEIKQRYRFLGTSSYPSMAGAYRDYLMKKYPELQKKEETSTPVNITLVGAVDEKKQRLGIPVAVPVKLTSYQDAYNILNDLKETGYKNLSIRYSGWMNGGIKQSIPSTIKTISELGSKSKLKKFLNLANESGVPVYLEGMVENAYNKGIFDGFVINRDVAKYSSRQEVKLYDFSPIYYGIEDWNACYYLLKPQLAIDLIQNLADYAQKYSAQVAFTDVGNLVSADYNPKNLVTRQQVIDMQQQELEKVASAGTVIMVNKGNDYTLPYVDYISDMNLSGSKYQIIDYMVPFYTMAIHGLIDYSGTSLNLSGDYQKEILESAESGAGLSFTFMKESTFDLQNSNYTYLFGANYDEWKDEAYAIYSRYEAELGHCFNQYITDHERLADGVFVTSYEDGTKVYVNYNTTDYVNGDITVPARDYKVEGR
ncbi:MAG TPA: DUF5696 domain-containing protein [Mobilitalea sp.]|nr:DUF5696 domain-containing protein [Mobilitalea sp.]